MAAPPARATLDIRRQTRLCPSCGQRFSPDAAFCPFDGGKLESATFDPLRDPLIGSTVDARYEVVALLGEGGMGQVYEVRHTSLDRRFAMKVLRRELARDAELSARFIDEAKATAAVRHANVVQITDFGKLPPGQPARPGPDAGGEGGAPYFVMELLVGQTLGRVIKAGGPIPAARAVRIVQQVASALAAAHAAGVVHRDLKPDNVFLVGGMAGGRASDDVRIVDFGAAKIIGSSRVTKQGIVFGTPHYMSPEQASGQPVDHRADIYSLGVIMYEMFTGRVPFEADTYMGVLTQHMFVQPLPPSQVSAAARELGALEDITLVCLAKKPEERYASMQELWDALAEVMGTGEGRHASDPAPRPSHRPSRAPPSVRYRMADELEPPSLEEMRTAIDSLLPPRRVVPWGWIAGVAGFMLAAGVTWLMLEHRSARPAVVPVASAPAATVAGPVVPPPPPLSAVVPAPVPPAPGSVSAVAAPAPAPRKAPPRPPPAIDDVGDPFAGRH